MSTHTPDDASCAYAVHGYMGETRYYRTALAAADTVVETLRHDKPDVRSVFRAVRLAADGTGRDCTADVLAFMQTAPREPVYPLKLATAGDVFRVPTPAEQESVAGWQKQRAAWLRSIKRDIADILES